MNLEKPTTDNQEPDNSEVAAITAALVGTWRYSEKNEPTGMAYLHFTADGRTLYFVYESPDRRIPVCLDYSVESACTLRLRPKGNPDGWICSYSFDGTIFTLLQPNRTISCDRVIESEIPEWFRNALADRLSRP